MNAQYDKIDNDNQPATDNSLVKNLFNKLSDLGKRTGQAIRNNTVLESDRLDIITNSSSSSSFQDHESLLLREQLWYKNKIILLSLAGVIIVIIVLIALFAFEPWK